MRLKAAVKQKVRIRRRRAQRDALWKRGGLLGKRKRKFPDQNDGRIYKNRERAVLEFTRKIAADPGIGAQDRPLPLRPTARHIGKHRQDRQFIIIIPKNERIVPEKKQAEEDDD